ncbi:glucosaminidase domain-containing protein [Terrimonas rubra]|uniref:Glucosaminidase domain-containing protein n=1 Tax=Terrimonas rubra TaxID=1035890 RepID=A0ABW6A9Z8_9BACT
MEDYKIYSQASANGMPDNICSFLCAQARHETGNYKHRFYTIGKNAFGYSYVKGAKWQLDKGGSNADNGVPIAQYASVENSVNEICDWIRRRQKEGKFTSNLANLTLQQYCKLLKDNGYYQAPLSEYTNATLAHFNKLPADLKKKHPVTSLICPHCGKLVK